jgi:hypothetical protein
MDMHDGDTLVIETLRHGEARLWPFTGVRREVVLPPAGSDDGMPMDPFEGLPLPEKLAHAYPADVPHGGN